MFISWQFKVMFTSAYHCTCVAHVCGGGCTQTRVAKRSKWIWRVIWMPSRWQENHFPYHLHTMRCGCLWPRYTMLLCF